MGKLDNVSRRSFLISTTVVGGGMMIGLQWSPSHAEGAADQDQPWAKAGPGSEFTPWLTIAPDNTVTVRCTMPEIGNGALTQVVMTVAEELNVDLAKINVEHASALRNYQQPEVYGKFKDYAAFFGGRSTSPERLSVGLQVGASARERLKAAAAAQWKVPVSEVNAMNSILTHTPTGRTLKYGDVAAKAAVVKLDKEPAPKPRSEWRLLGKTSPTKVNNPAIANGTAVYGMDVRLPGMVYAALRQAPAQGGRIKSYDATIAKKMPGVLAVVTVDPKDTVGGDEFKYPTPFGMEANAAQHAIAVIAEHYWQARKALDAVTIEWDDGPGAKWKTTETVEAAARALLDSNELKTEKAAGDIAILDKQEKIVEGVYHTPYCEQAPMEPLNGTALVTPDRVELWHPSQQSHIALMTAAHETGLPPEKVIVHQTYVGGGFGRRVYGDDSRMVVAVARKFPGRPVHVIWSREETTRQGRYRALITSKMRAGLDKKTGLPVAFHARYVQGTGTVSGVQAGLHDTPYTFNQNLKVEGAPLKMNVLSGAYRGPTYNSFAFMTETFVDECAHAAGIDPLEYRLKLLANHPDQGWVNCLKEAASKAGWGKSLPRGTGMGVAISNWGGSGAPFTGTTVAMVATVEVTKAGQLKVHQIDIACDPGSILNRDAVAHEMVGGAIFGMNMTLNERLSIRGGRIVEGNYDEYPMLRMGDVQAKINVHFGAVSNHERYSEIGEPPAGVVGPAIGNAIFAATGKRHRTTPFRLQDMSWV